LENDVSTINITRALRVENETGISGAEALSVDGVQNFGQVVSAGTEEQTALTLFKDSLLQAISLVSDQPAFAQFLGQRYTLVSSANSVGPAAPVLFVANGNLADLIFAGDLVRIEGTVGNDGLYEVATVAGGATTTITTVIGGILPGNEGAVGTIARVASQQNLTYAYPVTSTTLGTGAIVITGDVSDKFAAGHYVLLLDTVANDGIWYVVSVTVLAGVTTIIVSNPNLAVPVAALPATEGAVGYLARVTPSFVLAAGSPFLWSRAGGTVNPFHGPPVLAVSDHYFACPWLAARGDVAFCMVEVPGATNGNFNARIATSADIF